MAFRLFEPLFENIDEVTATFVNDFSSNVITTVTPFVSAALTISFIVYGFAIMRGAIQVPFFDFLKRSVHIGIIVSIALAGGLYQTSFMEVITSLPDSLANAFVTNPTTANNAANILDTAAQSGYDVAGEALDKVGFFGDDSLFYVFVAALAIGITGVLTVLAAAFLITAKVALALLAGFGPLFILALLFQPTARFFEMWTAQVLNYAFVIILMAPILGFALTMFTTYTNGIAIDGAQNIAYSLGGMLALAGVLILLIMQLPSMAGGLAGGVGLNYLFELGAIKRGIGGRSIAPKMGKDGGVIRQGQRGSGAIGATQSGVRGAANVSKAAYTKAHGYFKRAA